jgi:hypothetical protein
MSLTKVIALLVGYAGPSFMPSSLQQYGVLLSSLAMFGWGFTAFQAANTD